MLWLIEAAKKITKYPYGRKRISVKAILGKRENIPKFEGTEVRRQ
jgi:hypothetical protein